MSLGTTDETNVNKTAQLKIYKYELVLSGLLYFKNITRNFI